MVTVEKTDFDSLSVLISGLTLTCIQNQTIITVCNHNNEAITNMSPQSKPIKIKNKVALGFEL